MKSVQEVSKSPRPFSRTDQRYWAEKVYRLGYRWKGKERRTPDWAVKIQHGGRRELFPLKTPNRAAAAARAREIYLSIEAAGWDETLAKFKAGAVTQKREGGPTVGDLLGEIGAKAGIRTHTLAEYARSLRKIVAEIEGIDGGRAKFDYRAGGNKAWVEQIHAVPMAEITPEKVQKWKLDFIKAAGANPVKQRAARRSANTFLRNAKSLFSPRHLRFVTLDLPKPNPFDGVQFEPRGSMRYRSEIDAEALIRDAQAELRESSPEQFKIFVLSLFAGLRRNEIDKLEWAAVDQDRGLIRIQATEFFHPKTEEAAGDVEVDLEVMQLLQGLRSVAKGRFLVESESVPRPEGGSHHYRCQRHFEGLTLWLRHKGIKAKSPIHALRKEFGSLICDQRGIYAASRALRHADIGITAAHYLDGKRRVTVGLGPLLHKGAVTIGVEIPASGEGIPPRRFLGKRRRAK
ncbi:MAG TPA: hypothetical protein PLU30_11310 [Verrucomicrobiae bacterium]|nr:hypothetical protein [Verrucomicrobiae bacterium]